MDYSRRLDPYDLQVAHDDELPDYESGAVPEYDIGDYEMPLQTYYLRQVDRKVQHFVPYGASASSAYRIASRSARFFSKKPEIDVWRTNTADKSEEHVASIWFDSDGPLPWRPRAHFDHKGAQGLLTHTMESHNFSDWTTLIGTKIYIWAMEPRFCTLVLTERGSAEVMARFKFSARGTAATGGAEAGDLTIYRNALSATRDGVEKMMSGLVVAISNFKKMGRHYKNVANDSSVRTASLAGGQLPLHRASVTTYMTA